jgi:hypothetical protein
MQKVLNHKATEIERTSGFIQRKVKLDGSRFAQGLVYGWMANEAATLEELADTTTEAGAPISAQGLEQRFTKEAANFLQQLLSAAIREVVMAAAMSIPIIERFSGVYLLDSSTITLPNELSEVWKGLGGNSEKNTGSAVKLSVILDLKSGTMYGPELSDGKAQDRSSVHQHMSLPPGSLRLADLGYFTLPVLKKLSESQAYWLTRYRMRTVLLTPEGKRIELLKFLTDQSADRYETLVLVGAAERVSARLLVQRVPQEVADQRRRRLHEQARVRQVPVSEEALKLAGWTLMLTNVPPELLTLEEAMILARSRWQVELIFKLWKSHGKVDEWRSRKPWRIMCEVYAKMIGLLIQHWLAVTAIWAYPDHSLFRSFNLIQKRVYSLLEAMSDTAVLIEEIERLHSALHERCRISKGQARQANFQLLLALGDGSLP